MKPLSLHILASIVCCIVLSSCGAIEKSAASANTKNGLPGNTYTVWQTAPSGIFPKTDVDGSEEYEFDKAGNYTIKTKGNAGVKGKYVIEKTLISDADTHKEIFTVENIGGTILRAKRPDGTKIFCKNATGTNNFYGKRKLVYANDGSTKGSAMAGTLQVWQNAAYIELILTKSTVSVGIVDKATGKKTSYDNLAYTRLANTASIENGLITIVFIENFNGYTQAVLNATDSKGQKVKVNFNVTTL